MQVKLLHVLEEKKYTPVGGEASVDTGVRLVFTINRNLQEDVQRREFREDLFYPIAVVPIELPPLRSRSGDIEPLVQHFIEQFGEETGCSMAGVSDATLEMLKAHSWQGNIHQLTNAIQYAMIICRGGIIGPEHLPPEVRLARIGSNFGDGKPVVEVRQNPEKSAGRSNKLAPEEVEVTLARFNGNRTKVARELGVARSTLYCYLEEMDRG